MTEAIPLQGWQHIEASAGTGKTYTLTQLYLRAVCERGLSVERILVMSYTRAATAELRERLEAALEAKLSETEDLGTQLRLRLALARFDQAPVLTFHAFCQRVLQRYSLESGQRVRALGDAKQLPVGRVLTEAWTQAFAEPDAGFVRYALAAKAAPALLLRCLEQAEQLGLDPAQRAGSTPIEDHARLDRFDAARQHFAALPCEGSKSVQNAQRALQQLVAQGVPPLQAWTQPQRNRVRLLEEKGSAAAGAAAVELFESAQALAQHYEVRLGELEAQVLTEATARLETEKAQAALMSFGDVLTGTRHALEEDGETLIQALRKDYPLVIVDEFQDTDRVQTAVLQRLFDPSQLSFVFVGDPKQAIYAFRGANISAYLEMRDRASRVHTLSTNWRSSAIMVETLNRVFSNHSAIFHKAGIEYVPVAASPAAPPGLQRDGRELRPFALLRGPEGSTQAQLRQSLAEQSARYIQDLLAHFAGQLRPRDIAVLCRTRQELALLQSALRKQGVPSLMRSDASVLASTEAALVEDLLDAAGAPWHLGRLARLQARIGGSLAELAHSLRRMQARLGRLGPLAALLAWIDEPAVWPLLAALPEVERRLVNLRHLGELLQTRAEQTGSGPLALLQWLRRVRRDSALSDALAHEERSLRVESEADAVQLVTIHASKGLEYGVTVLPFFGLPPGQAPRVPPVLSDGENWVTERSPEYEALKAHYREGIRAEEMRLAYVALTRAKQHLVCGFPTSDKLASGLLARLLAAECADSLSRRASELALPVGRQLKDAALWSEPTSSASEPTPEPSAPRLAYRFEAPRRAYRARQTLSSYSSLIAGETQSTQLSAHEDQQDSEAPALTEASPWSRLPAGAALGLVVHDLLEKVALGPQTLTEALAATHLPPDIPEPALREALSDALATPASPAGLSLAQLLVAPGTRAESHFVLHCAGDTLLRTVQQACARAEHPWLRDYATMLQQLHTDVVVDFLQGYIDLSFVEDGAFYVSDYKTNACGPNTDDYLPEALWPVMCAHHYPLQAMLYALALHRVYAPRGLRYGGARYLFLRGMRPDAPGRGYVDLPFSEAELQRLDAELKAGGTHV